MTDEMAGKIRWVCEQAYRHELFLAQERVARATAERDDVQMRFDKFLDDVREPS
jgi:hypothetical protein